VGTANAVHYNGAGYNQIDQVTNRNWVYGGATLSEAYSYDDLNQLTQSVLNPNTPNQQAKNYLYDPHGNLLTKDGACTNGRGLANCQYNYTAGTHRLASITGTVAIPGLQAVVNPSFGYDANGNLTASAGVSVS
jgi:hypothetical protein